ncbi:MAG TPA: tRNA 2-selenouridine(34) synthase MnmH [Caldimonas sp.]|nr:tRNA 2-selenouridine(34) synthase MnmH [Caldimonas sp.]
MSLTLLPAGDAIARLDGFDAIVDTRSESEFAIDRLPGAVNWPTLTDAERARVGTEYVQVSPFEARKHGAVLAARNVARHIERELEHVSKTWSPLVYCWRGGQRSGALATVLDRIGFRVHVLEGGYREFRRAVVAALESLPATLRFRVVCGPTGAGKSRLLQALAAAGEPVLDLEALANHRGSVLGLVPGEAQPSQKRFDTLVWDALRRFDPARPVWVESESRKIGDLRVPATLVTRMRESPCAWVELALERRVDVLLHDYAFFVRDLDAFCARLDALRALRGREVVESWQAAARSGQVRDVVRDLLLVHYDPIYLQSMRRNFAGVAHPSHRVEWNGSEPSMAEAVAALRQACAPA